MARHISQETRKKKQQEADEREAAVKASLVKKASHKAQTVNHFEEAAITLCKQFGKVPSWVLGKKPERIAIEMLRQGLGKWPAPAWLYSLVLEQAVAGVLEQTVAGATNPSLGLLVSIKQGHSVYKTLQELWPEYNITRKQTLFLNEPPVGSSSGKVIWWCKLRSFGVPKSLVGPMANLFVEVSPPTKRWEAYAEWIVRMGVRDFGPFLDYFRAHPQFEVTGRTEASVTRLVTDWHMALAQEKGSDAQWKPSRYHNHESSYEDDLGVTHALVVKEIVTGEDLAKEGRSMHHCVYSYLSYVKDGRFSIFHIIKCKTPKDVKSGHSVGTIRVTDTGTISEARGRYNSELQPFAKKALIQWAKSNNLFLGRWG